MYDKKRPDAGEAVKKSWTFKGTKEVCENIEKVCGKSRNHLQIGGSMKQIQKKDNAQTLYERVVRRMHSATCSFDYRIIGEILRTAFREGPGALPPGS